MATTLSDTLYHGLLDPAPPTVEPKRLSHIFSRWNEWLPLCTVLARKSQDPSSLLHLLKTRNRSRMISCLDAGLSWRIIRQHRLDDPTVSSERFEFTLRAAIETKRSRMGRTGKFAKSKLYPVQGGRS